MVKNTGGALMQDPFLISQEALAYLGDSVIETMVRERLLLLGFEKSNILNEESRKYVTAINQAKAYELIKDSLTSDEASVFRRGKNSTHLNVPKSASIMEYKIATGLEALFGFLYLKGENERINQLFKLAYPSLFE